MVHRPEYFRSEARRTYPPRPSLAQIAQVFLDIQGRVHEVDPEANARVEAIVATERTLNVTRAKVMKAIAALEESELKELKLFDERNLRDHTLLLGDELTKEQAARLDRALTTIELVKSNTGTALRHLADLLAFDMPVNKILVQEAIDLCDRLVNVVSAVIPVTSCPACFGDSNDDRNPCKACHGTRLLDWYGLASRPEPNWPKVQE